MENLGHTCFLMNQKRSSLQFLNQIFANVNGTVKVLEDSFCDWTQFGFQKYEGNIELLGSEDWKVGHALQIYIRKENFMRHEIQGGRKFYKKYKKQSMKALSFKPLFQSYAELNLRNVAKKVMIDVIDIYMKITLFKLSSNLAILHYPFFRFSF